MTNAEKDLIFFLEDPVADLKQYAARIDCVLDDLNTYYFERFDPMKKEDASSIVSGFKKNAVRVDIALDCFCHMIGFIDTIVYCLDKAKAQRNAETVNTEKTQGS